MKKWIPYIIGGVLVLIGGCLFYVLFEQEWWKGALLAVGSILIDIGIILISKAIHEKDEEEN